MDDYILLVLEKREWTSKTTGSTGSTYCFNNQNSDKVDFMGHQVSISVLSGDTDNKPKQPKVFGWVNDMTDEQYSAFVEEYGDEVYYHIPTKEMLTKSEYDELGIEQDTKQQSQQQF